ncbi:metal ABC transporter permease [Paenibacillus whitsoniae]|uniref:Manganese transport system membrane protein MntC n=1 Tax=Paenibacillus whitsoniae TaxID=2496558 RepID=A0A430JCP3_9BACL|nr:metal ABC transporter permease [Paenibacillus whitsoniae]RTE08749.1 metal ABC transporter permease [Paenibacillus whitsoniae]
MHSILEVLSDPNLRWILMGCMLLGLSSGVIGCFAYLRKQSLMGDALAHAALPGVCIAFMVTGSKAIFGFLVGAVVAGAAATLAIGFITRYTRIKQDAAIAATLSVFFGFGIMLLTEIQHSGKGNQSGLDKFLFGQAATMVATDIYTMAIISILLISVCALLFKEFKLISFDPGFAKGLGYPVPLLEQGIMLLIVIAVVVGIQAVGVVLMAALLITPAVSARYWTENLGIMVILAGGGGALSGAAGTLLSTMGNNLPTGPICVLSATALFMVSIVFAPRRGLLSKLLTRLAVRRQVVLESSTGTGTRKEETA